jgi:glycerol-3-phosphate acyltransferase PlsY
VKGKANMEYVFCAMIGYGLGSINPSYLLSKLKHRDIRKYGTGNLGATNTFINFGRVWGGVVLSLDILKAFLAVAICQYLFPELLLTGSIAGTAAVLGHIFPVYLRLQGGKGIASLAGFILAADWRYFIFLLLVGSVLTLIFNYGCCISFSAALLFPYLYAYKVHSIPCFFILAFCSIAIIYKHLDNIRKIRDGKELPIREFLWKYIMKGRKHD